MIPYPSKLRELARELRKDMTDAEQKLWTRLQRKQMAGVQFYRQKPLGRFIVDFYAPKVSLVIEVDGRGHFKMPHAAQDQRRDLFLLAWGFTSCGLTICRYFRKPMRLQRQFLQSCGNELGIKSPPAPPFQRGEGPNLDGASQLPKISCLEDIGSVFDVHAKKLEAHRPFLHFEVSRRIARINPGNLSNNRQLFDPSNAVEGRNNLAKVCFAIGDDVQSSRFFEP